MKEKKEPEDKILPTKPELRKPNLRRDMVAAMLDLHNSGCFVNPGDLIYSLDKTLIPNYPDDYKGRRRKPPKVDGDETP